MSVDSTISFNPAFSALATRAYRLIQGDAGFINGGAMTNDEATQALLAANLMLKGWQVSGVNLFRRTQMSLSLTALQGTPTDPYPFSPNVISVLEARSVINPQPNLYERPMGVYSYVKYMSLPNKYNGTTSGPSVYMYDRQQGGSNLYVFPPPSNGCQINCTVGRIAYDVDAITSNVDLPQEWLETFVYNLADRLMDDQALADAAGMAGTAQRIQARAHQLYKDVLDFDRPDSVSYEPTAPSRPRRR